MAARFLVNRGGVAAPSNLNAGAKIFVGQIEYSQVKLGMNENSKISKNPAFGLKFAQIFSPRLKSAQDFPKCFKDSQLVNFSKNALNPISIASTVSKVAQKQCPVLLVNCFAYQFIAVCHGKTAIFRIFYSTKVDL